LANAKNKLVEKYRIDEKVFLSTRFSFFVFVSFIKTRREKADECSDQGSFSHVARARVQLSIFRSRAALIVEAPSLRG